MKSIENTVIKNKTILLRADLNVPVVDGKITDYSRIYSIIPSIKLLLKNKNKIFILAHFGRPNGEVNKKYSLKFLCKELKLIFKNLILASKDFESKNEPLSPFLIIE